MPDIKGWAIEVKGIPGLEAALARKVAELHEASAKAVGEEVEAIREDAQATAPRLTGELEEHIVREHDGTSGTVKSTSRHAGFMEFGTYKDEAQPYMKPAADRARKRFPTRAAAILRAVLGR